MSHAGYYYNETGNLPKAFEFAQREVASLEGSGLGESQNAVTAHHNLATMLTKFGEIVPARPSRRSPLLVPAAAPPTA